MSTENIVTRETVTPLSADLPADWNPHNLYMFPSECRIEDIIVDEIFQMRAEGTNSEIVERYAEVMKQNDPDGWSIFPEIKVLLDTESYDKYLIAGFHRLEAMKKNGYDEIRVMKYDGRRLDGLILAAGENADRSQPRTHADIKKSIETCLADPELRQWSNSQIARWCQVNTQTVINHEKRMSTSKLEVDPRPEKLKFIDKHGNISLRKAPAPSPPSDPEKQIETDHKAFIKHRNAAFDAWKRLCDSKEIPFDWDAFCLHAEEYLDGKGCLSLPNPNDTTLDELREKSLICQNLTNAIIRKSPWLKGYYTHLEAEAEPIPAEAEGPDLLAIKSEEGESKPDLEGLRNNLERMQGSGTEPNPSILTKLYGVPEDVVRSEIKNYDFTEAEPEQPTPLQIEPVGPAPSEASEEKEVTIAPADSSALRQVIHNILGRNPLITEFADILELISTFKNERQLS